MVDRCEGRVEAEKTPIGYLPKSGDIDTTDLDIDAETMASLISINIEQWKGEMESVGEYLDSYGDRLPAALREEHQRIVDELQKA